MLIQVQRVQFITQDVIDYIYPTVLRSPSFHFVRAALRIPISRQLEPLMPHNSRAAFINNRSTLQEVTRHVN